MRSQLLTCLFAALVAVTLVAGQIKTPGLYANGGNPDARLKAVLARPSGVRLQPTVMGNRFVGQIMSGFLQNNTYPAGQEVRALIATAYLANITTKAQRVANIRLPSGTITSLLSLGNYSYMPAFNASGPSPVRVRVISAYSTRTATSGAYIRCSAGSVHDVWAEFWGMAPRNLAFGGQMIFSGFVTFTAPPFNFRLCVKDVTLRNKTRAGIVTDASRNANWMELENYKQGQVERFSNPLFMWRAPPKATTHYAGDFASFEIIANNPPRSFMLGKPNITAFSLSDSVKLVPWGFPCTYEKRTERIGTAALANDIKQYCGSNAVGASGEWVDTSCPNEGAVTGGVARTGSRDMNPFATTTGYPSAETSTWTSTAATRSNLIAYLQLPAAGSYDVCVSTKAYRRLRYITGLTRTGGGYNGFASQAQPVWFKAYDASSSTPCTQVTTYKSTGWVAGCQPRSTVLTVTAAATTVSWTTTDDTPNSWGEIMFTAQTGTTLSYTAATQWEYGATRDYFNLTGGDMFRLVSEIHFGAPATATTGELASATSILTASSRFGSTASSVTRQSVGSSAGTLTTAGTGAYYQYYFGQPAIGTSNAINTGSGCFWAGEDNFGGASLNGNPGTQCCSSPQCTNWCSVTDSEAYIPAGVRTSGDLGGNPRVGYSPWLADGTGSTTAYAYTRVPPAGRYRVCYRTAQGHWRVLPGVSTVHTSSNVSYIPRALSKGYTYHFNDTRAGTWGPVAIRSLSGARIDKLAWTYYTTTTTPVVGSALKIVSTTESCYTASAQTKTYSINPGSMEDGVGLGSADDSSVAAQTVYFYVKVPAQDASTTYRICFRRAAENWQALSDPNFVANLYMTTSNKFSPRFAPSLVYTLTDTSAGSWGRFVFNRGAQSGTSATQNFNVDFRQGDMVRLVPNRTAGGLEVFCDVVVGTTTDPVKLQQVYSASTTATNLGQACAASSAVTTDPCYSGTLAPTDNSISAMTPYTNLSVASDNTRIGNLDGAVAFITLPPPLVSAKPYGYKVCYKNARFANWIETSGASWNTILNVKTGRTVTATPSSANMVAGTYTYIGLTAAAASAVTPQFDLVKLVPATATCEAPVVLNGGYDKYSALSGVSAANCIVDAANSTIIQNGYNAWGKATSARAYMVLPTPTGVNPGNYQQTQYRVCYMTRTSSSTDAFNWWDLGLITVNHVAVVYTVTNKPMINGALGIRFFSGYAYLDTRPSQDAAKVIQYYKPCVDTTGATVQPSGAASGATHATIDIASSGATAITDVGPTDLYPAREARINVVLPSTYTGYKVCYKTAGGLWMEIREAFGSQRIYLQSTTDSTIRPASSEVTKYTLASALTGQTSYLSTYSTVSWSTVAMGGASTYDGTTNYFSVTYSSAVTAGNAFALKLVQTHSEYPQGTYAAIPGADCFASGQQWSYSTTAGTSDNLNFNLPTLNGKYLVCLWSSLTSTWYQVPADSGASTTGVPMTVVSSQMYFVPTATGLQINDYAASGTVSMGGLAALDYVYVINASSTVSACGSVGDWRSVAVASAKVNLTATSYGSDTTSFLASRLATITLPATPARSGAFAVCVYRSQATSSNVSGSAPFVKAGWYQVRNDGPAATGGGSDVYVVSGATKLNITACPTNSSTKVRAGSTFDVEVIAQDASSTFVTYASGTARYGVTATGTGFTLQGAGGECTATNAPTYGLTSGALTQFMTNGKVKFSLTSLSACPNGVCTYSFTSSNGLTSSPSCSFTVPPTTVADVQFAVQAVSCNAWSTAGCVFRVVALHSDGGVAATINSGLTVTVRGSTGLNVNLQSLSGSNIGSPSFTNGVLDFQVLFTPSQYVAATPSQIVTLTPSANGKTGQTISVTVYRPIVSDVHVVDIYPVAVTGTPILPLVPFWEPTQSAQPQAFRYDDVLRNTGGAAIAAAAGYHLVAGQFYNIVMKTLVSVNGLSMYAKDGNAVPNPFAVTIDSTFLTALSTAGNAIHDGRLCSTESCTSAFTSYAMGGATSGTLTLRFQNAAACDQSCTVPFKFNGADIVTGSVNSITTPVRSVATTLRVQCATTLAGLATAAWTGCSGVTSTVNRGWYLNVSAVDARGTVDRFFSGDVIAVLNNAKPAAQLTTVAALQAVQPSTGMIKVTAVNGYAVFQAITVSKPCAAGGCTLELLSTWGTNVVAAGGLVATPNTVRLAAVLNKVLAYCDATSTGNTCNSVAGVSLANTTHPRSLIYKDTQVCASVTAVDSTGLPTLYETNWVMYYARDVTGDGATQALTLTDDKANTGFTQRYRAMVNSMVSFCFTISGFTSARAVSISFGAQRFGGSTYWAYGTTGTATIGPMKVFPAKVIARVLLNGAVNGDVVVGGTVGVVSSAKSSATTALSLGLSFVLKDHYNVTLSSADLQATETNKYLWPRMNADGVTVTVTAAGSQQIRGYTNATLVPLSSALNSTAATLLATLSLDGACLGCTVMFDLVTAGVVVGVTTLTNNGAVEFLGSNVTIFTVNTVTATNRVLAFWPGTSPLTSYWVNGSTTANLLATTSSQPRMHVSSCIATTCQPYPGVFNLGRCDAGGTTYMGAATSTGLSMRVFTVATTSAATSVYEPAVDNAWQVDVLNTYTVTIGFGNQLLSCVNPSAIGAACQNDNTAAVSQTVAAYGTSVRDAIGKFYAVADSTIKAASTNFYVSGISSSNFLAVNATTSKYGAAPSAFGAFAASATSATFTGTVSGIASPAGHAFYWKPQAEPRQLAILATALGDPCNDTATYSCSGGTGCNTAGLALSGLLGTGVAFASATTAIPVGVAFPITMDVRDVSGNRVVGASGTVAVTTDSWTGCNNGGAPTFTGVVANGRATVWLTFASACQACVMRFSFTPSASQSALFATMNANPISLITYTTVNVVATTQVAKEIVVVTATPAAALTTGASVPLTIASVVTLNLLPRGKIGNIPFAAPAPADTTFNLYPTATITSGNVWTIGNGGVLRTAAGVNQWSHGALQFTNVAGAFTANVLFSRTCVSCRIRAAYLLGGVFGGQSTLTFNVPATFVVTTAATQQTLVGYIPRKVRVNQPVAVSLWATGSEDSAIAIAGLAPATTVSTAGTPSFAVTAATNGNGGTLNSMSWVFNVSQIQRMSFTAPCSVCTVSVSLNTFAMRVATTATALLPTVSLTAAQAAQGVARPATAVALNTYLATPLTAIDDNGFVDELYGTVGCQWPEDRFQCTWNSAYVGVDLSTDGTSAWNFPVYQSNFQMADSTGINTAAGYVSQGAGLVNFSFTTPQRQVVPIYTGYLTGGATISSALVGPGALFPAAKYSVAVGLTGLSLSVLYTTSVALMTQGVANTFYVALTGTLAGSTSSTAYVAVGASNPIAVSFTSACPTANVTTSNSSLVDGYAVFNIAFLGSDNSGNCAITFTAGAGTGRCGTTAACTSQVSSVLVAALTATRFNIVRPTVWDNGVGSSAVPMYAHAGRAMRLRTQILGLGADGRSEIAVTNCPTCSMTVTSTDCNFASSPISATFAADQAEVSLTFPDTGANTYTCSITVKVLNSNAVAIIGPDRASTSFTYLVSVCKSASVKLLTNTTSAYRGQLLQTGVAYEFYAVMLTAAGAQCWGDSQDAATTLTLKAVDGLTGKALDRLNAVNVNATATTTAALVNGVTVAAATSAQVVGGAFRFQVVFTNSSVRLGLAGGIKLQISAAALGSTATSGRIDTIVAATRLTFDAATMLPPFAVKSRAVYTGPNWQTNVVVRAVDPLPLAWLASGLMSGPSNIASGAADFGSTASVFWRVAPSVPGVQLPLTVGGGSSATMSAGTASFSSVAWTGPDGLYAWSVQSATAGIAGTAPVSVFSQAATAININITGFNLKATGLCATGCTLPNSTFPSKVNATINNGVAFLSAQALTAFNLPVVVADASGNAVMGDSESILALSLNANAGSSVILAAAPAFSTFGTIYARVRNGTASFSAGFIGSTVLATGVEALATLSVSCPATKPASMLAPGESAVNPCAALTAATSVTFQVVDPRLSAAAIRASALVRAVQQVLKMSQALTRFSQFNSSIFKRAFLPALLAGGISYVDVTNVDKIFSLTTCLVDSQFNGGDLGSTVCSGTPAACSITAGLLNCPLHVLACSCQTSATTSSTLRRFLLQNSSSVNGSATSTEFFLDLAAASGFPSFTEAGAAAEYVKAQNIVLGLLQSASFQAQWGITGVSTRSSSVLVTPIPSTAAPTSPPSPPVAPVTTEPVEVSAASPLTMAVALLLALVLSMFAA